MHSPPSPYLPDDDPNLIAAVEEACAPLDGLLDPEEAAGLRAVLSDMLATHPVTAGLVAELAPVPVVGESGPVEKSGADGERSCQEPHATGTEARRGGRGRIYTANTF